MKNLKKSSAGRMAIIHFFFSAFTASVINKIIVFLVVLILVLSIGESVSVIAGLIVGYALAPFVSYYTAMASAKYIVGKYEITNASKVITIAISIKAVFCLMAIVLYVTGTFSPKTQALLSNAYGSNAVLVWTVLNVLVTIIILQTFIIATKKYLKNTPPITA